MITSAHAILDPRIPLALLQFQFILFLSCLFEVFDGLFVLPQVELADAAEEVPLGQILV